jgi:ribosome-associated protein
VRAIAESIGERLARDLNRRPSHVEGERSSDWILMDYVDFVVHVFREDRRQFYRLERLWGDAPSLDLTSLTPAARDAGST